MKCPSHGLEARLHTTRNRNGRTVRYYKCPNGCNLKETEERNVLVNCPTVLADPAAAVETILTASQWLADWLSRNPDYARMIAAGDVPPPAPPPELVKDEAYLKTLRDANRHTQVTPTDAKALGF